VKETARNRERRAVVRRVSSSTGKIPCLVGSVLSPAEVKVWTGDVRQRKQSGTGFTLGCYLTGEGAGSEGRAGGISGRGILGEQGANGISSDGQVW